MSAKILDEISYIHTISQLIDKINKKIVLRLKISISKVLMRNLDWDYNSRKGNLNGKKPK